MGKKNERSLAAIESFLNQHAEPSTEPAMFCDGECPHLFSLNRGIGQGKCRLTGKVVYLRSTPCERGR